jgi:hypothetical protein
MADYSKGKIYRIYSPSHLEDGEYIGSTIETLSRRMSNHRRNYRQYCEGNNHFISSFDLLKYDDARIELIEECPCENREQLLRKEGEYIRGSGKCLNHRIAGRTKIEYHKDNKDVRNEYSKRYYETHKEEAKEKIKIYRETHKEKVKEYKKKYRETHKEKLKEYQRKWYLEKKEKSKKD